MDLFFIRHGQSADNALGWRNRQVDPPLTDLGKRQAQLLAEHLATGASQDWVGNPASGAAVPHLGGGFGITSLFCSPMYRSMQTAEPVGRALRLSPQVWIDIHELGGMFLDHGGAEGIVGYPGGTRPEISAEFPNFQLPPGITKNGWWNQGYEDPTAAAGRATKVAEQLRGMAESEERVAIISHDGIMGLLLKALLGQVPDEHIIYNHHNTGISRLGLGPDAPIVVAFLNQVDHLAPGSGFITAVYARALSESAYSHLESLPKKSTACVPIKVRRCALPPNNIY